MSKLSVDQKTIMALFSDRKSDFLIPDYQRPYAWGEEECLTLWGDLFAFAFPEDNYQKFNNEDEYYLGSIVTYKKGGKLEVIDGQQRLTTLMLLLRAFYDKTEKMKDDKSQRTRDNISKCVWKTDEFGEANLNVLKINSEVATDNDKEEFLSILRTGTVNDNQKSRYARNFRYFQNKINDFLNSYPAYFAYFPTRILENCILLPIEAESQDYALRIFSTLNDRGKPLSDADIFKAEIYKFYDKQGKKEYFINEWRKLEELCNKIFNPITGTKMDELFTRYMYYERAKQGIKSSTTEALRKFYERGGYNLLKNEDTFSNLIILANFWQDVYKQNDNRFSDEILKKLFVLNYAPNGMWNYFVSVYFMHNKDNEENLDDKNFSAFLTKIIAFIWVYAIMNPGVNALRTPIYADMVNVVNGKPIDFADIKFDLNNVHISFTNYSFSNIRPITKSMLAWWAFTNTDQEKLSIDIKFDIEHIFPRKRQENEKTLKNEKNLESLGNKSLLEQQINIRASEYRFSDKANYYIGYTNNKGQLKKGTQINELVKLSKNSSDFTEKDIEERNKNIIEKFISFLNENGLINTE